MQRIIEKKLQTLWNHCQRYDVKTMYVLGSAPSDGLKEDSDIDVLIDFK